MLLKSNEGACVACDLCATRMKDNFVYYSFEGTPVIVDTNTHMVSQQPKDFDIDVCEKCYADAETMVRNHLAPAPVKNTVKCDYCTKLMSGKFTYHIILIHKVYIDKQQAREEKADGSVVVKPFKVEMKFMDFNLDDNCFSNMLNTAFAVRQKIKAQGDWS